MKTEFFTLLCVFAIFYILLKPKVEEQYKNVITQQPIDLFSDGLDHKLGLNKKHRHHSF